MQLNRERLGWPRLAAILAALWFIEINAAALPAAAQDAANGQMPPARNHVDWKSLNLTASQQEQIQRLDNEWNTHYSSVMPQIRHQQMRLRELFKNPKSDPLEIVATQQSVTRLQEQLRSEAMANYLRKRALLSPTQQKQLESQMSQMVADRQQRGSQHGVADEQTGGIMNLIQKVRWAIEPH
jgi:Spy/CpxP family protein refolding chaperone